jgi:hypothetical protein
MKKNWTNHFTLCLTPLIWRSKMKLVKTKILAAALIGLSMNACFFGEDAAVTQVSPEVKASADAQAQKGMDQLMSGGAANGDAMALTAAQSEFKAALAADPNNSMAHVGMALSLVASVQHDAEVKKEFGATSGSAVGGGALLGRVSKWTVAQTTETTELQMDENSILSAPRLQNYVESKLIPRLDSAMKHLDDAIARPDAKDWTIVSEGDTLEIDLGEVYVARAGLRATRAALLTACLYDLSLNGQDGTMAWVDQAKAMENPDSLVASVIKRNLSRSEFLALRAGKSPAAVRTELLKGIEDLRSAAAYVRAETDDQSHDLLSQDMLRRMDSSYNADKNTQMGMAGVQVDGALTWFKDVLNGKVLEIEEMNQQEQMVKIQIKPAVLFDPGIKDLKSLLPYYTWKPENTWLVLDTTVYNPGTQWEQTYIDRSFNPIEFTNELGVVVEQPVFRDYTFGGFFPGMTRVQFESL